MAEEQRTTEEKVDWPDAPWFWFLPDPKYSAQRTDEILSRVRCPECDEETT